MKSRRLGQRGADSMGCGLSLSLHSAGGRGNWRRYSAAARQTPSPRSRLHSAPRWRSCGGRPRPSRESRHRRQGTNRVMKSLAQPSQPRQTQRVLTASCHRHTGLPELRRRIFWDPRRPERELRLSLQSRLPRMRPCWLQPG